MPKVKVNPNAVAPSFITVAPGEYPMQFKRVSGDRPSIAQSEKGNWTLKMQLAHLAASTELVDMNNQPLKPTDMPGSVFHYFTLNEEQQGRIRQAFEAVGMNWAQAATAAGEFATEEAFGKWIEQSLDQQQVTVKLKTDCYQGNWSNKVERFIVAAAA